MSKPRINADLDEILFENRNKAYGAYAMRTQGDKWLLRATLIAMLLFLLATVAPAFLRWLSPGRMPSRRETPVEDWSWISMILPPEKPAPKTPEPPKVGQRNTSLPSQSTTRFVAPNPSTLESPTITLIEIDSILNNPGLMTLIGTGAPWIDEPEDSIYMRRMNPGRREVDRPDPKAFVPGVEREPQEVNLDDLKRSIGYPTLAKEGRIQGTVTLRVLMDETGTYREHINVSRPGTHILLVKAVEEHIAELRCLPGLQNGKAIPMWVNVSFSFKLL